MPQQPVTPDSSEYKTRLRKSSSVWSDTSLETNSDILYSTHLDADIERSSKWIIYLKAAIRSHRRLAWDFLCSGFFGSAFLLSFFLHSQQDRLQALARTPGTKNLQFINASHPYFRFVGRWTPVVNGTGKDGCFPGVYFDFEFNGSSNLFLSLGNAEEREQGQQAPLAPKSTARRSDLLGSKVSSVPPISLLVKVDDDDYLVFRDAASFVSVRNRNLNPLEKHAIRVIAPMVQDGRVETLQIEGIYLDKDAHLIAPSSLGDVLDSQAESLSSSGQNKYSSNRKMIEIITDLPKFAGSKGRDNQDQPAHNILKGIRGWDYLLGEMFDADHASVGMGGMCLVPNCIGGKGDPATIAELFFRSGPVGSEHYTDTWEFQNYIPDVLNLGNADWQSFSTQAYEKSIWELSETFEDAYVSLIRAIRSIAYPKYPTAVIDFSPNSKLVSRAASDVPIFVMRPLRGQLEGATHAVVDRLRSDGDNAVFWLDTSGWLDTEVDFDGNVASQDFVLDESSKSREWRLTERGHQRVAILLHLHVCRYLAKDPEKCAFLPPEIYQATAQDPKVERFDEYIENERERRLKTLFWTSR
ncbi:hypothetical protein GLAREA_02610 [Glarea lozoyensis ATCC 20868]|uniref:Uncharacterized protein n=1 Tax=Glarea lozoyensis (strain ATCC 20868 / MF5171) TaxID=1116229 RepID=S3CJK2_GLAL2|nr:uncharacterized protein GLAREA_02610 [Glarea lozoyensis ATCC 20868]EPE26697.1 hypothetical protein GLAREA_02610 [Glarea lozoyensis ATCC 20868]